MNRIIDFSDESAELSVRYQNLLVAQPSKSDVLLPLNEIAALVVSHPSVRYTHAVLSGLAAAGGVFVTCDERRLPVGMMLPLQGNFVQAERYALQAEASLPTRKRLWARIVRAKMTAQAAVLEDVRGDDRGLRIMAARVRSGDTGNLEAQASRIYWPALMGRADFRRDREADDANRLFNYGYAVLRAIVARAICGAGLHPALGLHHHNRYDAFPLADDLMEPFRPVVDRTVIRLVQERGEQAPLDKATKATLIGALTARLDVEGEARTLFDISARLASSVADAFGGEADALALPDLWSRGRGGDRPSAATGNGTHGGEA